MDKKELTPYDSIVFPVLQNILIPIFGYILGYVFSGLFLMIIRGTSTISIFDSTVLVSSKIFFMVTLTITTAITILRFLSDDYLIIAGKMMQEPIIQKLRRDNKRLKEKIKELSLNNNPIPINRHDNVIFINEDDDFVIEQELSPKSQTIYDNAIYLWDRVIKGEKITKEIMTDQNGLSMPQRQWKNASDILKKLQIISTEKQPIVLNKEVVIDTLYKELQGQ